VVHRPVGAGANAGTAPPGVINRPPANAPTAPPTLPGRAGKALKWAVASLLVVAIGLGSWQLADALKSREDRSTGNPPSGQKAGQDPTHPAPKPIKIVGAKDFDPMGDDHSENPGDVPKAYDNNPATYWQTSWYTRSDFGGLKPGVGVILDLGSAQHVSSVKVDFVGDGTGAQLLAAPPGATSMPTSLDGFSKVASGSGAKELLSPSGNLTTRYLVVWLVKLPQTPEGNFRGKISEISVTG